MSEQTKIRLKNFSPVVEYREDGVILVGSSGKLDNFSRCMTDLVEHWANEAPDRTLIAQRGDGGGWESLSYAQALSHIKSVSQFLLSKGLSSNRPLVILSGNSIEHLVIALAAMYIGVPYVPVSTAYSLADRSYGKLSYMFELLTPGLVFVDSFEEYQGAIETVVPTDCQVLSVKLGEEAECKGRALLSYEQAINTKPTKQIEFANLKVDGDTIAKFLFTSGSTGLPKAVINTHKMLCANQAMVRSVLLFLEDEPPIFVDWLPWSHTFGGNFTVGMSIYNGGTYYIDHGKPVGDLINSTLDNLKDVSPTIYFNVPKGYEVLVRKLKSRPDVAESFFANLKVIYYAAASLSQNIWDELEELSVLYTGKRIPILSGLGSTETAPAAFVSAISESPAGVIGLPLPGVDVKLIPVGGKLGAWVKGVNVTPGYWRSPDLTAKAFDEDGFYSLGDALRFMDPARPGLGLLFDGRVSEDFKLDTGTWVSVSSLRNKLISHFSPLVQDVVITGRDRSFVGGLVFPDVLNCRKLIEGESELTDAQILSHPSVLSKFSKLLLSLSGSGAGSSKTIRRILLLGQPPRLEDNEITDKGSINQAAVIQCRHVELVELYAVQPSCRVISI
ncbi:feruloyl-CoA synthase [Pseudomonas sp. CES]|uniref:feruloyl-CoA synthase n=1 Tax=Pseudomonas sp. CES TaxID=2719586 RepID=UPI00146FFEE5|nr:feruloyl-CoA synthase [Pseudomonas sp. CES]KAF4558105.1 feruloyl-CoA synthase [Pseudomonas sp. CES]